MAANKYKTKARHTAWTVQGDNSFNPLARKFTSKRAITDLELGTTNSLNVDPTQAPINHPQTFPPDSPRSGEDLSQGLIQRPPHNNANQDAGTPKDQDTPTTGDVNRAETEDHKPKSAWRRLYRNMFLDDPIPAGQQIRQVLFPHWYTLNWLLVAAPVGIALHYIKGINPLAVFLINFLAIVPLAGILCFATEEIALRVGEVVGGLLNASFGNAVELIVGIIALAKDEIIIVQTSLIGSILSNLLLVMGMCFFFGGIQRQHQNFNSTVAQTAASMLALAVGSLIIPTAYTWVPNFNASRSNKDEELSRGTSIILLVVYASYLIFQLKSHKDMFNEPSKKVEKRKPPKDTKKALASMGAVFASSHSGKELQPQQGDKKEDPSLTLIGALITLCAATALIGICAEFLVDSISEVACQYQVSRTFIGLVLLPVIGNATEHATAVTVAVKDKMDLAIGVAVGSSMQIALLVLPLMVVLGWIIHSDMTLIFDNFYIAVLFVAVILVNYLIADGKSHWLEGVLLMALYVIISVAAYFYPQSNQRGCSS